MRDISSDEIGKVIEECAGSGVNTLEVIERVLPGFKNFYETNPDCKQILTGHSEATAVLYLYGLVRQLPVQVQTSLKDVFFLMAAVGYFLREQEGLKVPEGATVH